MFSFWFKLKRSAKIEPKRIKYDVVTQDTPTIIPSDIHLCKVRKYHLK